MALERRKEQLSTMLATASAASPAASQLAKYCDDEIAALHHQLGDKDARGRATQMLRTLVERIELVPDGEKLVIVLCGAWPS
ncbi:hypothetical protein [Rhizobium sp. BK060]|uniref:hypothetical protein n=1 Tax=Rhizobium sp. BK060 TaxID=2587096 RepID=UPI00161707D8|nr:hypothetical protein [Rhizobium sp. BK060]MBB3397396.1 DNA-directed RNA polymerase specialized sigma subunit [Rhizobium sp. BK060]